MGQAVEERAGEAFRSKDLGPFVDDQELQSGEPFLEPEALP